MTTKIAPILFSVMLPRKAIVKHFIDINASIF
jgi:hypothetical protein